MGTVPCLPERSGERYCYGYDHSRFTGLVVHRSSTGYAGGYQCCHAALAPCDSGGVTDAMTQVLEARRAFDEARAVERANVARKRALLGLAMIRARESGSESQATIAAKMGFIGTQQVRSYEQAYRDWVRDHPGELLEG